MRLMSMVCLIQCLSAQDLLYLMFFVQGLLQHLQEQNLISIQHLLAFLSLMSRVFGVQCLSFQGMSCLVFVCVDYVKVSSIHMKHFQYLLCLEILCPMSRVCCVQCLSVQSLSFKLFICIGLVMLTVCLCRVC